MDILLKTCDFVPLHLSKQIFLGGGHCPEAYCQSESFNGGEDGGDGHGFVDQHSAYGQGTHQDISKHYMQNFKITPGNGGLQNAYEGKICGGGGGGVLIDGKGPERLNNQGEGYGGGAGGKEGCSHGLPGAVLVEVVEAPPGI